MKRKSLILLPICVLVLTAAWAAAAAGGAADPLASLSYLQGVFTNRVDTEVDKRLDASDALLEDRPAAGTPLPSGSPVSWEEIRLKEADTLSVSTGSSVLLLAGSAYVSYSCGAVVDVTNGEEIASGSFLTANHRYMAAEDTAAVFTVGSKTAVLDYQGDAQPGYSDGIDYNAMAAALKSLHLFQGSATGYGQGFDLELAPTRLQAIIMFIRVLGEEEQALAWTGTTPFRDVPAGSQGEKYIGYAYQQGYTNGYTASEFRPAGAVNARQYTEFILRAMGYSSPSNTNLSDTLRRAQNAGVLTAGEAAMLENPPFLRADLVYISYYALDSLLPDGVRTLADQLMNQGIFTSSEWEAARTAVPSGRV